MAKSTLNYLYNHLILKQGDPNLTYKSHERIVFEKGQIANEYYSIESGLVRAFTYNFKGDEITINFVDTNEILFKVSSLFRRIPS